MTLKQHLLKLINQIDLNLSDEQCDKIISYVNLLEKWNKVYNLTSIQDPYEMIERHIIDSLVVNKYIVGCNTIADIGTGAGLPGIPLAIANPNISFFLLDSRAKRTSFLNQVKILLKLSNVTIVNARVENYNNQSFDGIISRAFASAENFYNITKHLSVSKSKFFALKGKDPDKEFLFADGNEVKVIDTIKLQIPNFDGQRHLVILEKV